MADSTTKNDPMSNSDNAWQGAFAAFGLIFKRMKKNPMPLIVVIVLYVAASIVSLMLQRDVNSDNQRTYEDIVFVVLALAIPVYSLALARDKTITVQEFLQFDIRKFVVILLAGIMATVAIIASVFLLIIPIIWTAAWFSLYAFTVVDGERIGPIEALERSKQLAQHHKDKVWGVIGVTALLAVAVTALWFVPLVGVGSAAFAFMTVWYTAVLALLYVWLVEHGSEG